MRISYLAATLCALAVTGAIAAPTTAAGSSPGFADRQLVCEKPADAPADVIHFEAEGNKYFLNLANQSILASAESRTKWEFRACHLPQTPDKPATLGYPPATSGHLTLTSDYATTICLHADYEREIIDYKPCNYLDDSGQQEFYFLYDKDAKTVRLAGKPNSEEQSFWKLQLGAGRPPAIAVKPRAKDDSDEGIVFAWQ